VLALRELQASFWKALSLEPGSNRAGAALLACLPPSPTQSAAERLQVYVDAYFWRLIEVMRDTFKHSAAALSEDQFVSVVRAYLAQHPSQHPSVSYVGRHFPEFLATRADVPAWAADLAKLEWVRAEVFEAPNDTVLSIADLRALAPEAWSTLRFSPHSAVRTIASDWPLMQLWEGSAGEAVQGEPSTLRVWRAADWRVLHCRMPPREARAWQRLCRGDSFPQICEEFADLEELQAAQSAMAMLLRWVEDGLIAQVFVAR
jgi:hypothetical protein